MTSSIPPKVIEGVYRNEYSLLLGAGASIGSLGGDQQPLPSGPDLRDILVDRFSIPTEGHTITLPRAYAAARRTNSEQLEAFIRYRFTNSTPDWQHALAYFRWHRIWTLNIDDLVENVYRARDLDFDRFDWTSRFRDTANSTRQIIHLHGYAKSLSRPLSDVSDVVFSVSEYVTTLTDPRAWHAVFTDEFTERPFIVLGASLIEEFDLQQALTASAAAESRGYPSIIVLRSVTQLEREELEALGLIVIESTASAFIELLRSQIEIYQTRVQGLYKQHLTPQIARFLQQFRDLRQFEPPSSDLTRHFYAGYEPHWRNILDNDDAARLVTERSLTAIRQTAQRADTHQTIFVLTGSAGTGKSTGLLRIARSLVADGLPTFEFRADEDLDINAVIQWLRAAPDTVLLFPECADFADSLRELAQKCSLSEQTLLVVGAERSDRRRQLRQKIDEAHLRLESEFEYGLLTDYDIGSLVAKLGSRRRLGHITRRNVYQQHAYFRTTASRRLFEGMANLEGGQGFRIRIKDDYNRIHNSHLKRLYAATSIGYYFGHPVPLGIAAKVSQLPVKELERLLTGGEHDYVLIEEKGVRPPHRFTAELVVKSALDGDDRYDAVRRIALAVAPHLDIAASRILTRPYRLLRPLLYHGNVLWLVGEHRGRELYETIQEAYDWNGRYWDQRALFESELGNHPQARSYAENSLRIHRHPFAFNTLGTVLGRIAIRNGDVPTLREAVDNLRYSRDGRRWEASEHPYVTFFTTMIKFGETWGLSAIPMTLRNNFNEWLHDARRTGVFLSTEEQDSLQEFQADWLYLATR